MKTHPMLFLRRIPRLVAVLQLLPTQPRHLLVNTPSLSLPSTSNALSLSSHLASMSSSSSEPTSQTAPSPTDEPLLDSAPPPTCALPANEATSPLPPLSASDFQAYNRMAAHMAVFHDHFRAAWNQLWQASTTSRRPAHLSLRAFVNEGLQFCRHLTMHHDIEETYIFPVLAKKMPDFQKGKGGRAGELIRQHREIHAGLDGLEDYLRRCKAGEAELELDVLRTKMESWGTVLWTHLDQEVETLGAENMRRYWTLDEMRQMPM
jgi:hemerythrin-like domain-containing protein